MYGATLLQDTVVTGTRQRADGTWEVRRDRNFLSINKVNQTVCDCRIDKSVLPGFQLSYL